MSILFRLLLLVIVSVVPSAALEVWRTEQHRQHDLAQVPTRALRLAEIAAAEQMRILEGARQLLTSLAIVPVVQEQNAERCNPVLRRVKEQFPIYTVIGAADLSGRIWCSSAGPGADVSDRLWFQHALQTGSFTVGGFLVGRASGWRVLNLALPVRDANQKVVGVLNAGLDLELLAEDLAKREPAPGISLTVMDPDGIVLVDLPDRTHVGQALPERLSHILHAEHPGVMDTNWITDSRQLVAYVRTRDYSGRHLHVAVGLDHGRFVGDAFRQWPSLAVSAGVLAAALLVAWFIATSYIRKPIARLMAVTERWRQGDMTARAGRIDGSSEISKLGAAFDAMADTVVERKKRLSSMLESTTDSVFAIDRDWRVTFQNHRASARFGSLNLVGQRLWDVVPDVETGPVGNSYRKAMDERVPTQITLFYEPLAGHFEANAFPSADGGITVFVREVTEEVRAREELLHQAHHDPLTDLPNRSALRELVGNGENGRRPQALVLFDLDGFKHVNDTLGHAAGDLVLRDAAARLAEELGDRGRLARLGGDEFAALIFEGGDFLDQAVVDHMLAVLEQSPFVVGERYLRITASAGIVRLPPGKPADPETSLANADLALYRAKAAGGGVRRVFSEADRTAYEAQRLLEEEIGRAAEQGEFELHYQPQVRLSDGAVVGAEALLRWRHPTRGLLTPGAFLEALENSRHARPVSEWILNQACAQVAAWRREGLPFRVGVNLVSVQLASGDLAEVVEAALAHHGLPPEALELELTENIALSGNSEVVLAPLRKLRARGVGIALDDFGTGFASLTTLRDIPASRLKIDRSFIAGLSEAAVHNGAIVESVLLLASRLGLEVIAEGVENLTQETFLASHGCTDVQGYRYGRPMPAEEFLAASRKRNVARNQHVEDAPASDV